MNIDATLRNWGSWARERPIYGHCHSIEHRYRSPQCWNEVLPKVLIDPLQALETERVMRFLPRKHRLALKFNYVFRAPWRWSCQRLVLRYDLWGEHLSDAQNMVANRLRKGEYDTTQQAPAVRDIRKGADIIFDALAA